MIETSNDYYRLFKDVLIDDLFKGELEIGIFSIFYVNFHTKIFQSFPKEYNTLLSFEKNNFFKCDR